MPRAESKPGRAIGSGRPGSGSPLARSTSGKVDAEQREEDSYSEMDLWKAWWNVGVWSLAWVTGGAFGEIRHVETKPGHM